MMIDKNTLIQSVDSFDLKSTRASFSIGQIIQHHHFNFRGVVVDVDPAFQGNDDWYDKNIGDLPPKHSPWYHVAIDDDDIVAYVPESLLTEDLEGAPIQNPMLSNFFTGYDHGRYHLKNALN